jgi:hypothetical protein
LSVGVRGGEVARGSSRLRGECQALAFLIHHTDRISVARHTCRPPYLKPAMTLLSKLRVIAWNRNDGCSRTDVRKCEHMPVRGDFKIVAHVWHLIGLLTSYFFTTGSPRRRSAQLFPQHHL